MSNKIGYPITSEILEKVYPNLDLTADEFKSIVEEYVNSTPDSAGMGPMHFISGFDYDGNINLLFGDMFNAGYLHALCIVNFATQEITVLYSTIDIMVPEIGLDVKAGWNTTIMKDGYFEMPASDSESYHGPIDSNPTAENIEKILQKLTTIFSANKPYGGGTPIVISEFTNCCNQAQKGEKVNFKCSSALESYLLGLINKEDVCNLPTPRTDIEKLLHLLTITEHCKASALNTQGVVNSLNNMDKQLLNLLALNKDVTYTDSNVTGNEYQIAAPSNVLPYAQVNTIGGMSNKVDEEFKHAIVTSINELEIPSGVLKLNGYGLGLSDDIYNYIDFTKKQFVQKVSKMTVTADMVEFQSDLQQVTWYRILKPINFAGYNNAVDNVVYKTSKFENGESMFSVYKALYHEMMVNKSLTNYGANLAGKEDYRYFCFGFAKGTTLEEAKAALDGVEIIYELVKPVKTDISSYIHDNKYIAVTDGQIITFANNEKQAVHYDITYQVKK